MTEKLQNAANRGKRAEALLNDELLSDAFKALEADYIKAWGGTHPAESDARETYWRAVQIISDVRKHLGVVLANGKVAQTELNQLGGLNRL